MGDAIKQEIENNSSNSNIYIVQEGDTLSDIAYRFGGDGTREVYEQFARDNNITDADHIVPGQVIDLSKLPNYNGDGSSGGGTSGGGGTLTGGGTSSRGGTSTGGGTSSEGGTSGGGGSSSGGGTSGSTDAKKEPTDKKTDTSEPPENDDESKNDSSDKKNDIDKPPENDDGSKKDSSDKPVTNNDDGSTGGGSSGGTSGTGYDFKYDNDAMNSDWKAVEAAETSINQAVNDLMNALSEFCSNLNTLNANLYATPDTSISSYYDEFSELIGQSYSEGINGLIYYACKNAEDVIQTAEDWNNTI